MTVAGTSGNQKLLVIQEKSPFPREKELAGMIGSKVETSRAIAFGSEKKPIRVLEH